MLVSEILSNVREVLQDELSVRWADAELINYLNDGLRSAVLIKPDVNPITQEFTCAAGYKQSVSSLGNEFVQLIDIPQVTTTGGGEARPITFIKRNVLDMEVPTWRSAANSLTPTYFMYDPRQRDIFYVYPPASAGATLEVVYCGIPTLVTATGDTFPLLEMYASALVNYVLWRAYTKDSDFSGDPELAGRYYASFYQLLTGKMVADNVESPDRKVPPKVAEVMG